jgi:hypothetical protein
MRKLVIVLSILVIWALYASQADAKDTARYYRQKDRDWTAIAKVEALKTLLVEPTSQVFKCNEQEVSDKATLRNKKIK